MRSLHKPMIGLLVATLAFFALWYVELRPSASTSGGSPSGLGQYQSAINKAHQAVATSNAANAKLGAPVATTAGPKSPTSTTTTAASPTKATPATKPAAKAAPATKPAPKPAVKTDKATGAAATPAPAPSAAAEVKALENAVAAHKVVALLFYNPAGADDQAMKQELGSVPTHGGQVFKLAVPVSELAEFQAVTAQVPVVTAPTVVVIDTTRQATMITGFASQLEINQRVADALPGK